jgi:hypothetical protein
MVIVAEINCEVLVLISHLVRSQLPERTLIAIEVASVRTTNARPWRACMRAARVQGNGVILADRDTYNFEWTHTPNSELFVNKKLEHDISPKFL